MVQQLKAPFPWFGGKATVADDIWKRFGVVRNYVEPFAGSLAVLLNRPLPFEGTETVNDADGLLCNFWRAVQSAPDDVARWADWPVNENDLHARHSWLVGQRESLQARLEGDPDYCDAKAAGWWVWGICLWIGSGWCSGEGPWQVIEDAEGVRQLVHLGDAGQGINRKLVHLGNAGRGSDALAVDAPPGVGGACEAWAEHLACTMQALSDRLRRVRVCCGDWPRVCGPTPTVKQGTTAVFLDPPYGDEDNRRDGLYRVDSGSVASEVRKWAIEWGDDKRMRIALCGYDGFTMPNEWRQMAWKAKGGYGSQGEGRGRENAKREIIWFSKHCELEPMLFEDM